MVHYMGLIKAIGGAIRGTMADQWKEYFYCDSMDADVLVTKGTKRVKGMFGTKNSGSDKHYHQRLCDRSQRGTMYDHR